MANEFNKEERVAFELMMEGFQDALVMSKNVSVYNTDSMTMERTGDAIWRPQPYIAQAFDGMDQSDNFKSGTQLSVPATLGFQKSSPFVLDAKELRDALQEQRLGKAAKDKLASVINQSVMNVAAMQGSLVVKRTVAATGFDDVALCEAIMNEQGVPFEERYLSLSTRDYNGMASNLAGRQTMQGRPETAYDRAFVGTVSSFDTFKLDYANRISAATASGITINTTAAGSNNYVPKATSVAVTGERSNVDNRFQQVTVNITTNIKAGDCFTITGVNAVHHITKQDTGQLKTYRVISVDSSNAMTITPPLVTNQNPTDSSAAYQNCVVNTPASNSAIVFLNTVSAFANPFWQKDAIELLPGKLAVPSDAGAAVLRNTTDNGIEVVFMKWFDIKTAKTLYRLDTLFGVVNKQPEMSGLILFGQS